MSDGSAYDAIILAGGRGSRLGLVDKATLDVGDGPLLERTLEAVDDAVQVTVVGPTRALPGTVAQVREDPAFAGPTAALVAGLNNHTEQRMPWTAVLACDLPLVGQILPLLRAACIGDGAVLVDCNDRRQWVAGIYRTSALLAAADALGDPSNLPLRALLGRLELAPVYAPGRIGQDVDTWDQVSEWNDYFIEGENDD